MTKKKPVIVVEKKKKSDVAIASAKLYKMPKSEKIELSYKRSHKAFVDTRMSIKEQMSIVKSK